MLCIYIFTVHRMPVCTCCIWQYLNFKFILVKNTTSVICLSNFNWYHFHLTLYYFVCCLESIFQLKNAKIKLKRWVKSAKRMFDQVCCVNCGFYSPVAVLTIWISLGRVRDLLGDAVLTETARHASVPSAGQWILSSGRSGTGARLSSLLRGTCAKTIARQWRVGGRLVPPNGAEATYKGGVVLEAERTRHSFLTKKR